MSKNYRVAVCAFLLCCCIAFGSYGNIREQLVKTAETEVGVREATGNNDGQRVEQYLAVSGFGKGFAWCAAFCAWVFKECGIPTTRSAWCPDWFPSSKVVYFRGGKQNQQPRPGDVFGLWIPAKNRVAHQGIIIAIEGDELTTVEGNTNTAGSREGDGVYKKFRLLSQVSKVSRWIKD